MSVKCLLGVYINLLALICIASSAAAPAWQIVLKSYKEAFIEYLNPNTVYRLSKCGIKALYIRLWTYK